MFSLDMLGILILSTRKFVDKFNPKHIEYLVDLTRGTSITMFPPFFAAFNSDKLVQNPEVFMMSVHDDTS